MVKRTLEQPWISYLVVSLALALTTSVLPAAFAGKPTTAELVRQADKLREQHSEAGYTKAVTLYRKAINSAPKSAIAYAGLAMAQLIRARTSIGSATEAQAMLKEGTANTLRAVRLQPGLLQAQQAAALSAILRDDADSAKRSLRKAQLLDSRNPMNATLWGLLERDAGKQEYCLRVALKRSPKNYLALVALGSLYKSQGHWKQAERIYHSIVAYYPENAFARNALGAVLEAQTEMESAETELREALRLVPTSTVAAKNLGDVLMFMGRDSEAVAILRQAVKNSPDYISARLSLATAYARNGKTEDAIGQLKRVTRMSPGNWNGWYNLGSILLSNGRAKEAEPCLRKAVSLAPRSALALMDMGWCLYLQDCYAEARSYTQRACLLAPDLALARFNLGTIALASGKPEEAVDYYESALAKHQAFRISGVIDDLQNLQRKQPNNKEIDLLLGLLLEKLDTQTAVVHYERYIAAADDGPLRQRAMTRLGALTKSGSSTPDGQQSDRLCVFTLANLSLSDTWDSNSHRKKIRTQAQKT